MLQITNKIYNFYSQEQREALRLKTQNQYTWTPFNSFSDGLELAPLALTNKDKTLFVKSVHKLNLTSTEAVNNSIMEMLCHINDTPNSAQLTVIYCKKGWTFYQDYLVKSKEYEYLDRIALFLQTGPVHKIKVFKKDKHAVIVTNLNSETTENTIFSAIPLIFKEEFTWSEKTIEYFRSNITDKEKQFELYKEIIAESKILENIKLEKLIKIVENANKATINYHISKKQELQNRIKNYEQALEEYYKDLNKELAFIAFYDNTSNNEEIAKYIYNNPYIVDYYSSSESRIVLAIEAPLEYIDVPAFRLLLKNTNSYLYPKWSQSQNQYSELTKNHPIEFVEMLKDLFLSNKYKIYSRAEIILDLHTKTAQPLRRSAREFSYRPAHWTLENRLNLNKDRCIIPHLHIEYYDCWSGNKTNISKALHNQDLIGAIDICVNTTKDINVNDSAVFGRLIKETLINPKEFITGYMPSENSIYKDIPGAEFKTIWDNNKKCFRTFLDIFENDYIKNKKQVDCSVNLTDYIL